MRTLLAGLLCFSMAAGNAAGELSNRVSDHSGIYRADRVHGSRRAMGVPRDRHGRIKRSRAARSAFVRLHPCPATGRQSGACPGYVVDHVDPLECGGLDAPSNMQWQTVAEAKLKDRTEGNCRR